MSNLLTDMHCHLHFATQPVRIAEDLLKDDVMLFTNTVDPNEWEACTQEFDTYPNVFVGYGWHPWWVTKSSSINLIQQQLAQLQPTRLGEIGLDFGQHHTETRDQQVTIFKIFAEWAARKTDCLLSIHAVNATAETLEILSQLDVFNANTCIYHWFNGTSEDLKIALNRGCYFSVSLRMLASKRGREYVRQIPLDRLLLESDLPSEPHTNLEARDLKQSLAECAQSISEIKGVDSSAIVNQTAQRLLSMA